jgi:hypothetical protein
MGHKSVPEASYTDHYLRFKPNHPHHIKRGVVHNLFSLAKVICQNQDFENEIKNIRHDLMFSEYPEEFIGSVMKLSTRALSSSHMLRLLPRN